VRYSNVRDISKLLKAVNSVCFGNVRVKAKVARFDKVAVKEVEMVSEEVGKGKGVMGQRRRVEAVGRRLWVREKKVRRQRLRGRRRVMSEKKRVC